MGICSMLYERAIAIMADYSPPSPKRVTTATVAPSQATTAPRLRRQSLGTIAFGQRKNRFVCRRASETLPEWLPVSVPEGKYAALTAKVPHLVVAVSHSDRAASFHKSNGFSSVRLIPFCDEAAGVTPFYVHILAHEPSPIGLALPRFNSSVRGVAVADATVGVERDECSAPLDCVGQITS